MPDDSYRKAVVKNTEAVEVMKVILLNKKPRLMRKPYEKYAGTPVSMQTGERNMRNTTKRSSCSRAEEGTEAIKAFCAEENVVSNIEKQTEAKYNG